MGITAVIGIWFLPIGYFSIYIISDTVALAVFFRLFGEDALPVVYLFERLV